MKKDASSIPLVPFSELKKAAQVVLSTSKRESDKQLAAFHAENAKRRAEKKKAVSS